MRLPDSPLDQPKRLAIMILLERHYCIEFSNLYRSLGMTRGAVDSHLKKLEDDDYITKEIRFEGTTSKIMICPSQQGLVSLQQAKQLWKELLDLDK